MLADARMESDDDLWPGDWRKIGTAAKDIAAHTGRDLDVTKAALCRIAFSDGKVDKRLVEYEWDEFRQVSVADRSTGVRVDVDEWPILGPDGILWSTSSSCERIEPKKKGGAILGGHKRSKRYYGATATRSESGPHINSVHDQHPCNFRPSPQAR
jgi:hypothetical protein